MKMNLKGKLTLSFLLASVVPLIVLLAVSVTLSRDSLESSVKEKILALQKAKGYQVQDLFYQIKKQATTIANSSIAKEGFSAMNFSTYELDLEATDWSKVDKSLTAYYSDYFTPTYNKFNSKPLQNSDDFTAGFDQITKYLQYNFISNNKNAPGLKQLMFDSGDDSNYSRQHKYYHEFFKDYLESFGFGDIYLINNRSGKIIYSVLKASDYGTSLKTGPLKDTSLAKVWKAATETKSRKDTFISDMVEYFPSYNVPKMFVAAPIFIGASKNAGTLVFQVPVSKIDTVTTSNGRWGEDGYGQTGEVYLVGQDKKMRSVSRVFREEPQKIYDIYDKKDPDAVAHMKFKNTSAIGLTMDNEAAAEILSGESGFTSYTNYMNRAVISYHSPIKISENITWGLISEITEEEAFAQVTSLVQQNFLVMGFSILGVVLLSFFIVKQISSPITAVNKALSELENGQLSSDIVSSSGDEVGQMVAALQSTLSRLRGIFKSDTVEWGEVEKQKDAVDKALKTAKEEAERAREAMEESQRASTEANEAKQEAERLGQEQLATAKAMQEKVDHILAVVEQSTIGDLTSDISVDGDDAVGKVGRGLQAFYSDLKKRIGTINDSSCLLGSASEELLTNSEAISQISINTVQLSSKVSEEVSEVAFAVNEVSNNTDQLSSSFSAVAGNTNSAAQLAADAVTFTNEAMKEIEVLEVKSKEIEEIVAMITSISSQTNLLALNATIEAARAGEAGKGFAVVANEVKELASQTNDATNQIREQIEHIQHQTAAVVTAISQSSNMVSKINETSGAIAATVEEQSSVTQEISDSMGLVNGKIQAIQGRISEVLDLTRKSETGVAENMGSAGEFKSLSKNLVQLMSHFKTSEDKTLNGPGKKKDQAA